MEPCCVKRRKNEADMKRLGVKIGQLSMALAVEKRVLARVRRHQVFATRVLPTSQKVQTYLEWAHKTFQHTNPSVNVQKLVEEVHELAEDPCNGEEMADVLMLLLHQSSLAGVDLAAEFNKKLQINLQRTWHQNADGTYSHDG